MGGVRAFVMTDIVGSTRRWADDASSMTAALACHDGSLRAVIESAGGTVFKHPGDGMIAVFEATDRAIAAATATPGALPNSRSIPSSVG